MNKLGNNIRCLRMAYGETQEQLGFAIDVAKNTISSYEKGRTEPDKNILSLLSVHFTVSVEELLTCNFSGIDKITFHQNKFWERIIIYFPNVLSEHAMKNEHFKKAYSIHRKLWEELQKQKLDNIDKMETCFEEYIEAIDDENSTEEAIINIIGIYYMITLMECVPKIIKNQTAAVIQITSQNPKIRRLLENTELDFEDNANEPINEDTEVNFHELLPEFITYIKKSDNWRGLGDYYLALQYFLNLADNNMTWEFNRRIGVEMLRAFSSAGNFYATCFLFPEQVEVYIL